MIITLTTDFGLRDPYVGIMKGVILGLAPQVRLIDITHDVESHDVAEGAFALLRLFDTFLPEPCTWELWILESAQKGGR